MNLSNLLEKSKSRDATVVIIIILVAFSSYGLGRLSRLEEKKIPISISEPQREALEESAGAPPSSRETNVSQSGKIIVGGVVAGKSGNKYHYPWCPGARQIAEANKRWFASAVEARQAGLTPAGNCKGLR